MGKEGTGAHPHRGIATLTYILKGEGEHFDSRGHHAKVHSGGIQWMKAGNGIVHDESMNPDSRTGDPTIHGFQFWINLPSQAKKENPEYLAIEAVDVPTIKLPDGAGWLKVVAGAYNDVASKIPSYSKQYLYHIHLLGDRSFSLSTEKGLEYAAFLPEHNLSINSTPCSAGEFIEFDREDGAIEIHNTGSANADIIFFGGERYAEPIVAQGPFVMNSEEEIADAYNDFFHDKYGKIDYKGI